MTTTVHLLRHGEVFNPGRVLYGRMPGFHLSELGERQAAASAEWLATRDVAHLVSSPLERARQTADALATLTGLEVATDERLIEAANELEGRQVAGGKGLLTDPSNWKYFRNPFRPSWGEPYVDIAARMSAATRAARDLADGREAVCVSHQLPVVIARRSAEGLRLFHDPRRRQCSLASVTSLTFDGDRIVRLDYREPAASLPPGEGTGA
ncbi:histidine phosphatase family protein [Jatrophihabitans endophyticus]|uniref:histidine phosphatase family protein n=1 Tax=Jatrophihabitans endophyticus TaxID=1206085 RepID=UPI0019F30420|nr:histidine phosphatase family protein [Jatrophihabitans endophyticus]MBE7187694.1 histidine phosphatase family protein [Jatrophihabitans endophyticus]